MEKSVLAQATLGILVVTALFIGAERLATPPVSTVVSLTTAPVPELHAHEHGAGDKVSDKGHGVVVDTPIVTIEEDTWVTDVAITIDGAPQMVLHHALLYNLEGDNLDCPGELAEVISFGQETPSPVSFPQPYGIFLPKGSQLYGSVMLHNPLFPKGPGENYLNVSATLSLTTVPSGVGRDRILQSHRLRLSDINDCVAAGKQDGTFSVPIQTKHFVKASGPFPNERFVAPTSGTIVRAYGHVHPWEGGERLEVFKNGELLLSFLPHRTTLAPWSWSMPGSLVPVHIEKGDEITIASTYSNESGIPTYGAMGMLGFYFAPDP